MFKYKFFKRKHIKTIIEILKVQEQHLHHSYLTVIEILFLEEDIPDHMGVITQIILFIDKIT
jgi:hypothetical protein